MYSSDLLSLLAHQRSLQYLGSEQILASVARTSTLKIVVLAVLAMAGQALLQSFVEADHTVFHRLEFVVRVG